MPEFAPVGEQKGKAVHMMDIHAEKGLQCADCHFAQDAHGNGFIFGEVANAIEILIHGSLADAKYVSGRLVASTPVVVSLVVLRKVWLA
mgnify:CR=1 FL=1